jgi:hypothetical protein
MDNDLSRYPVDMHVNRRMGETINKRNKYDLALSCIFSVVECLK